MDKKRSTSLVAAGAVVGLLTGLFMTTPKPLAVLPSKTEVRPYVYPVREVIKVHDGDSGWVVIDLGFDTYRKINYRVWGLDTPEVTGKQKFAGEPVRDVVIKWMADVKYIESRELDKYGRCLAEFYNSKGEALGATLLLNNLAMPYDGSAKTDLWNDTTLKLAAEAAEGSL